MKGSRLCCSVEGVGKVDQHVPAAHGLALRYQSSDYAPQNLLLDLTSSDPTHSGLTSEAISMRRLQAADSAEHEVWSELAPDKPHS